MTIDLNPIETDLLTEVLNIGVGQAAASLSQLVNQEIQLSVPAIELKQCQDFIQTLGENRKICGISQTLSGPFKAESILLFAEENSLAIVKEMLGHEVTDEQLTDLQQEALVEIGNIVLNACIGGISKALNTDFAVALPEFNTGMPHDLLQRYRGHSEEGIVLLMQIELNLKRSAICGYMAFILQPISLVQLKQCLNEMLSKITQTGST